MFSLLAFLLIHISIVPTIYRAQLEVVKGKKNPCPTTITSTLATTTTTTTAAAVAVDGTTTETAEAVASIQGASDSPVNCINYNHNELDKYCNYPTNQTGCYALIFSPGK